MEPEMASVRHPPRSSLGLKKRNAMQMCVRYWSLFRMLLICFCLYCSLPIEAKEEKSNTISSIGTTSEDSSGCSSVRPVAISTRASMIDQSTNRAIITAYNPQDRPNLSSENPMKGLSKFLFFPMVPAANKKAADQILISIEQALARIGKVHSSKIIRADQGKKVLDLQPLATAVTLIYELNNVQDIAGKELGIVRASLNLTTTIQIQATKQFCGPYIWSSNCFFKGSVESHTQELVSASLGYLLNQFNTAFTEANAYPPTFDLQGAE